jgi:hypothetical protein
MDTVIVKGGKFTFTLSGKEMARGLRPTSRAPRNSEYLYECQGALGIDGSLDILDSLTRMDTSVITDGFPFPQLFVFSNMIIVCGLDKIYEWNGSSLDLKYTATTLASSWSAVDFFDYVYLSNGREAVVRDAGSKAYSLSTTLPTGTTLCNYNGQVLVGAPDIEVNILGASLMLVADPLVATTSQEGEWS